MKKNIIPTIVGIAFVLVVIWLVTFLASFDAKIKAKEAEIEKTVFSVKCISPTNNTTSFEGVVENYTVGRGGEVYLYDDNHYRRLSIVLVGQECKIKPVR